MSFLEILLRPKARPYNEEIKPIENDPVGLLVEKMNDKPDNVNPSDGQVIEMKSDIEPLPPTESLVTPLKPSPGIEEIPGKPYDPLLSLLKVTEGSTTAEKTVALKVELPGIGEEETNLGEPKQITNQVVEESVSPVVNPESDKQGPIAAPVERFDEDRDHIVSVDLNKDIEGGEIKESTPLSSVIAESPLEDEIAGPSPLLVQTEEKSPATGDGGILDIFRDEVGEDTRTISVPLEQINIQVLLEESLRIRNMLEARSRL